MLLFTLCALGVIAPFATSQDLSAQLHNASATGDVQELANLVEQIRATKPYTYLDDLSKCYEGQPSDCNGENPPGWCSVYAPFTRHESDCLSVLHTAAVAWQSESVKYLTDIARMDVDALDKANQTALHAAFDSFTVYWHPCSPSFRNTVVALLAAGMSHTKSGQSSVHGPKLSRIAEIFRCQNADKMSLSAHRRKPKAAIPLRWAEQLHCSAL